MIVSIVACGDSASEWHKKPCDHSIAVNDAWKFGHPTDSLLIANWPVKFPQHRLDIIKSSKPKQFYSHIDQWRTYFPNMVKIRLNSWDGHLYKNRPDEFSSSQTSPFIALSMAYKMGATKIILWGVEMIGHMTYNKQNPETKMELRKWRQITEAIQKEGVEVFLGAPGSALEEFLKIQVNISWAIKID
jgi:hypothetical protein